MAWWPRSTAATHGRHALAHGVGLVPALPDRRTASGARRQPRPSPMCPDTPVPHGPGPHHPAVGTGAEPSLSAPAHPARTSARTDPTIGGRGLPGWAGGAAHSFGQEGLGHSCPACPSSFDAEPARAMRSTWNTWEAPASARHWIEAVGRSRTSPARPTRLIHNSTGRRPTGCRAAGIAGEGSHPRPP